MLQRLKNPLLFAWALKFTLHVITGAASVSVHYGLMACLLHFEFTPVAASSLGFIAGALTRFFTAYYNVYTPVANISLVFPKFLLALAIQFVLNSLMVFELIGMGIGIWSSQVVTTVLLTFGNYLVYRLWVFR